MAELRTINEMPIHILQQLISVLLVNQNEENISGHVGQYYLTKKGSYATVIFDDDKVSYIANFVQDKMGNWFFTNTISVGQSLKSTITEEMVDIFSPLFEEEETNNEEIEENNEESETPGLSLKKEDE